MSRPLPPLDLLVGFEAAARLLSFSKAGDEVFVTQSAISRQVKKLEEYLGLALFERQHRSLVLTESGRVLFEVSGEALARLSTTVESLRRGQSEQGVRISTTSSFAALWLVPHLSRFKAQYPDVALHVSADNRVRDLSHGGADLAVRYCAPEQAMSVEHVLLSGEDVFPVCSPALLRRRSLARIEDLGQHSLLHLEDTQNAWPWLQWTHWIRAAGGNAQALDAGLRWSHFDQLVQAAAMGHGVALGRAPLVNHLLHEGLLVAPLSQRVPSPRSFFLRYGARRDAAVDAVATWLQEALGQGA
ncbi:LysR substrate-binding domain-containing protein [Verminephrobacter aporrectodeae]|uniref:LysR substrate-binding domain-containing protein n=1 Tax=Verminephrobacter aporrectodeae TaxID=1110389 RepID=UPI00049713DE|nr:LysR substrate-binding domain-containing protein [Verminephrobacter aporrectodeae]